MTLHEINIIYFYTIYIYYAQDFHTDVYSTGQLS